MAQNAVRRRTFLSEIPTLLSSQRREMKEIDHRKHRILAIVRPALDNRCLACFVLLRSSSVPMITHQTLFLSTIGGSLLMAT
jgi:hypothetical protein